MIGEDTYACCCDHNEEALLKRIGELAVEYRGREGSLIQVPHMAQGIYGCLSLEVQKIIADTLGIGLAEVSGVATLYPSFSIQPRGEHIVRICLGMICYVGGGKKIAGRLRELLDVGIGETMADRK